MNQFQGLLSIFLIGNLNMYLVSLEPTTLPCIQNLWGSVIWTQGHCLKVCWAL